MHHLHSWSRKLNVPLIFGKGTKSGLPVLGKSLRQPKGPFNTATAWAAGMAAETLVWIVCVCVCGVKSPLQDLSCRRNEYIFRKRFQFSTFHVDKAFGLSDFVVVMDRVDNSK